MLPIRFSHLKAFGKAPIFAKYALAGEEVDPTYAMERGTAVHALLFGTKKVVAYHKARDERHKEYQEFKAAHEDAHILTAKELDKARAITERLMTYRRAMELLRGDGVINEFTMLTKLLGRDVRGTPDARGPEGLVDLKSTGDCSPAKFYYHVKKMGYHVQLAWYARLAKAAGLPAGEGRFIVGVETSPPFEPQVYRLPPDLVIEGDKLATLWFEGLLNCERSNAWPSFGPEEIMLEKPYQDDGLDWGDEEDDQAA